MELKKVLILTYFFPPANIAGSYRIFSWAKYLHKFGFYPIIITRRWDKDINTHADLAQASQNEIIHQISEGYEVFYLPYKPNLRDRIYSKYGESNFVIIRKALSFIELIIQNISNVFLPIRNILEFSKTYIEQHPDIKIIITSGRPYILFKLVYLLNNQYKIKWIADYRDEWNSSQWLNQKQSILNNVLISWDSYFEKKWLSTCERIISISPDSTLSISKFVNKKGCTILNGFDPDDFNIKTNPITKEFCIVYNGTLYNSQPIEIFLNALKKIIPIFSNQIKIKIIFAGIGLDPIRENEIKNLMINFKDNCITLKRIPKNEIIQMQMQAQLLLMVGHQKIIGAYSSKIFEYLACKRPIILCPSDNDIIDKLINETNTGYICHTEKETSTILSTLILEFIQTGKIHYEPNLKEIEKYTREYQTKQLAELIINLI